MESCYFCHKTKSVINDEHVIPEAIGGGFVIKGFCKPCNSRLGKNIDSLFINIPSISRDRYLHNIRRGKRKIKNPFSGKTIKIGDNEYTYLMNNNGEGIMTLKPVIPDLNKLKKGESFDIEIDAQHIGIAEKVIERITKKHGVQYNCKETNRVKNLGTQVVEWDSHNDLLLGFSKMLFETAAEFVPNYCNSPIANKFSKMLLKGEIDYSLKEYLNPSMHIVYNIRKNFGTMFLSKIDQHILMVTGMYGVGLVGLVKVFNNLCIILLSNDLKYANTPLITVYNDFLKSKAKIFRFKGVTNVNVIMDGNFNYNVDLFNQEMRNNGGINIFDQHGNLFYDTPFDIINDYRFPQIFIGNLENEFKSVYLIKNSLFVSANYQDKHIPIKSIVVERVMEQLK